jgi:hypothetical protein
VSGGPWRALAAHAAPAQRLPDRKTQDRKTARPQDRKTARPQNLKTARAPDRPSADIDRAHHDAEGV